MSSMYNNRPCPQTPAPHKTGPRFPMSAAILETPSIMSSFREPEQKNHNATAVEPPPKQFVMSFPPNTSFRSPNDSVVFAENSQFHQQGPSFRQNTNTTQSLNGSFLDCSFSSDFTTSSAVKRKIPLANCTNSNTAISKKIVTSTGIAAPGLNNFHRSVVSASWNDSFQLHSGGGITHEKRPISQDHGCVSKFNKLATRNNPKGSFSSTTSIPDAPATVQESKTSLRIISGTIEHLQKTIREQGRLPLLLETVANVVSIKPGTRVKEKVILLRHRNQGPVMQGVFYEIDLDLPRLEPGDLVRCVGRLQPVGSRLQILKIGRTTEQYNRAILRLQTVSAFTTKVRR